MEIALIWIELVQEQNISSEFSNDNFQTGLEKTDIYHFTVRKQNLNLSLKKN